MLVYLWASLLLLRWCSHACAQGLTSVPAVAPAPGPVAAAGQLYPYQNNLNPVVQPSAITDNGTDWCKPFKPCNRTGPAEGAIESSYSTGLAPAAGASSVRASAYRYASIVPPSAVDWRQALTPWPVRNQAACGAHTYLALSIPLTSRHCATSVSSAADNHGCCFCHHIGRTDACVLLFTQAAWVDCYQLDYSILLAPQTHSVQGAAGPLQPLQPLKLQLQLQPRWHSLLTCLKRKAWTACQGGVVGAGLGMP